MYSCGDGLFGAAGLWNEFAKYPRRREYNADRKRETRPVRPLGKERKENMSNTEFFAEAVKERYRFFSFGDSMFIS